MVVYNELVAITAGAGLLGFAWFLAHLIRNKRIDSEGWAGFFGVTGLLLLVARTAHHGDLALRRRRLRVRQHRLRSTRGRIRRPAAASPLCTCGANERSSPATSRLPNATALAALKPISIFVGALGLAMAVLAITFVRFQLGAAPPEEPISGRFGHLPILEALFLGGLWGVVAVGALLFAIALLTDRPQLLRWAVWAWIVGGVVFLLFGAMNFYTHIGMYYNIANGTMHKW